jgi:hypothetical protein
MNKEVVINVGKDSVTFTVGDVVITPSGQHGAIESFRGMIAIIDDSCSSRQPVEVPVHELRFPNKDHRLDNMLMRAYVWERDLKVLKAKMERDLKALKAEIKQYKIACKRQPVRKKQLQRQKLCPAAIDTQLRAEFPELY